MHIISLHRKTVSFWDYSKKSYASGHFSVDDSFLTDSGIVQYFVFKIYCASVRMRHVLIEPGATCLSQLKVACLRLRLSAKRAGQGGTIR